MVTVPVTHWSIVGNRSKPKRASLEDTDGLELLNGLPREFRSRLSTMLDETTLRAVVESFDVQKKTTFRINTLLADPNDTIDELQQLGVDPQPVGWCDHAFWVAADDRDRLTHATAAVNGRIYIQGLSSILATLVLDPQPGEWNLDLAAAPGGKSTHIVARMQNQGKLSVVEPVRKRMFRLADNLKRLGSQISRTYLMDGRKVGQKVPDRFDRVLLDAPCSSEARMRTSDPKTTQFWSPRKIREQSRKQLGLIESAFQSLKPGGTLLYCTCSFAPEENEAIVSALLDRMEGEAILLDLDLPIDNWQPGLPSFGELQFHPSIARCRRILPNSLFDAFFMGKIRKAV